MTTLPPALAGDRPGDGGVPARRAVVRWAWRLFRREWRQQLLILALITVAVGGTIVGSAVAASTAPPRNAGFGTAEDAATFTGASASRGRVAGEVARLARRFGRVEVIEDETMSVPGSIESFQLRAEDPHGPYIGPMLSLVAGRYPSGAGGVAVTRGVASAFHLRIGDSWRVGGRVRRVVGIVENPQSLLDEFALVLPGQVTAPTQVTLLFDAPGLEPSSIGPTVATPASVARSNPLDPETISLAALVIGMLLVALVSVGGFTVLAQRRLRAIGMLESIGATDRHVRLVVRANGIVVGLAGAVAGFAIGLLAWLAYRPTLEQSAHHVIGLLELPWDVVAAAMVLAVAAAYFAASRPARAVSRVPVVTALSGRPAPPRQVHRSALPGIAFLVAAFLLLGYAGGTNHGNGGGGVPELVFGIVLLVPGLILLAPFFLALTAKLARRAPIAARLALRDLARYRARSGSALAAISVGVLVAVIVALAAASRYGNVLDYAGPNLSSSQLVLYADSPSPPGGIVVSPHGRHPRVEGKTRAAKARATRVAAGDLLAEEAKSAGEIASALGARAITLETTDVNLASAGSGRSWSGPIYVATPRLLRAFGIKSSDVNPKADFMSSRPGLSGVSGLYLLYGNAANKFGPAGGRSVSSDCSPATGCVAHPVIQEMTALPGGTSAPNTVITENAVRELHLQSQVSTAGWLVQGTQPFTAAQIESAQLTASTSHLAVESKNDEPSSYAVITWATLFGIVLALGVLAMSVGLVRSETASDLRTLTATGASSFTRRMLTAVTAGALGCLGALLGTVGGYIALIGWLRDNSLNDGIGALGHVPVADLLLIVFGMPAFAAAVGWLLAGREPPAVAHQPIE